MHGAYVGRGRVLVALTWGGKLLIPSSDLSLMPELITRGVYEAPLTRYLIRTMKAGMVAFDIGANVGYFTVLLGLLVGPTGRVVAYEADPRSYSLLLQNISLNYVAAQVEARQKAAYSRHASLSFYLSMLFYGNSSTRAHSEWYFLNYPGDQIRAIEVEAEPLDVHLPSFDRIDLVKIDVEGGEFHVLSGMEGLIRAGKVRQLVLEVNRHMAGSDYGRLISLLGRLQDEAGVQLYLVTDEGQLSSSRLELIAAHGSLPAVVISWPSP